MIVSTSFIERLLAGKNRWYIEVWVYISFKIKPIIAQYHGLLNNILLIIAQMWTPQSFLYVQALIFRSMLFRSRWRTQLLVMLVKRLRILSCIVILTRSYTENTLTATHILVDNFNLHFTVHRMREKMTQWSLFQNISIFWQEQGYVGYIVADSNWAMP